MKIVVWKDGSHRIVEHSWEYENDQDWLVTISDEDVALLLTPTSAQPQPCR